MKKCQSDGVTVLKIRDGLTSRTALGYELGLLSSLIQMMGICDVRDAIISVIGNVKGYRDSLFKDFKTVKLIDELNGKNVSIYGTSDFRPSFRRWKMSLNDDLNILSFYGELPEFNHNEIVGWSNHYQNDSNLSMVILRGANNDEVLKKIVEKIIEVLEENGRHVIDIPIPGSVSIERNLCAVLLGDYISQVLKEKKGLEGKI